MSTRLVFIDYLSLFFLLILLISGLCILLVESFSPKFSKKLSFPITFTAILLAIFAVLYSPASQNSLITNWLNFDSLSTFFTLLFLSIGLLATLLAHAFFKNYEGTVGEYYFLFLSALFGLILIGSAADFLTIFLGLETLSISLYVLTGYMKKWAISAEASIKYFLLGSLATACFVFGTALIYGSVGTTNLHTLLPAYQALKGADQFLFLSGAAFVTLGLAFKGAIAPFHFWAPDVYEGSPTPLTAFMAAGVKAGAFAAFTRIFMIALPDFDPIWNQGLTLLAYITLIYANFLALRQTQLRRFFAYSGISHAGFLLFPIIAKTPESLSSLEFYIVVYALATLSAFAVLTFLDQGEKGVTMEDLKGLFYRSPYLSLVFILSLLTLAGIPPTAGFFAKFYIFMVAYQDGYIGLVIVGLLTSILSAFYYLRIISYFFIQPQDIKLAPTYSWAAALVGATTFVLILWLSVYPEPLMAALR